MDPVRTVRALADFEGRGPGTDAERRAALWVRDTLHAGGREATVETVWVRPHWPWVHALHAALGATASTLSVPLPGVGLALGLLVLVSMADDLSGVALLARRLTPARATQNVVSGPPGGATHAVRLVICASLDAPRTGAARWRPPLRLLTAAVALVCALAGARVAGLDDQAIGIAQLIPTVALLVGVAVLIDVGLSDFSPAANAGASAAATALALAAELDVRPPRNLDVELVIAGAGQGPALGMRAHVRSRRKRVRPEELAVLALEPCGTGTPRWWTQDGLLVPLRLHPHLIDAAAAAARDEPSLGAKPVRGHGATAAYHPRRARWPAIAVGSLDEDDRTRTGTREDTVAYVDPAALHAALTFCLALVGRLDARLDRSS